MIEPDRPYSLGWPEAYGSRGVRQRIAKLNALWPLRGRRLLDVGCGNGSYTTEMAAGFDEIFGIEIEPDRLRAFRQHLDAATGPSSETSKFRLAEMSVEALDFPDCFFDVVTAIEVIEHIVDDSEAAGQIYRVLNPGGAFLITAPNRWFPIETHSFKIRGQERRSKRWPFVPWVKPLHRRISTARNYRTPDLDRLLVPHGFTRVGIDYLMPPLERNRIGRFLRPATDALDRTPLKTFGVSIVAAYMKPPS